MSSTRAQWLRMLSWQDACPGTASLRYPGLRIGPGTTSLCYPHAVLWDDDSVLSRARSSVQGVSNIPNVPQTQRTCFDPKRDVLCCVLIQGRRLCVIQCCAPRRDVVCCVLIHRRRLRAIQFCVLIQGRRLCSIHMLCSGTATLCHPEQEALYGVCPISQCAPKRSPHAALQDRTFCAAH